jgi:hypothetical protein
MPCNDCEIAAAAVPASPPCQHPVSLVPRAREKAGKKAPAFVAWEGDALVLRQLNPPSTLRMPRAEVLECHLVAGTDQEG